MCWVYFLKYKDGAFDCLKEFENLVENRSGCSIKCLMIDHGGEFCSNEFVLYLTKK